VLYSRIKHVELNLERCSSTSQALSLLSRSHQFESHKPNFMARGINQDTCKLTRTSTLIKTTTKHVELNFYFVRERVAAKTLKSYICFQQRSSGRHPDKATISSSIQPASLGSYVLSPLCSLTRGELYFSVLKYINKTIRY
jgi:hypothetical protein